MPVDYRQRLEFAVNMFSLFEVNDDMLLFMCDEAYFHLKGFVNKQNYRYYATELQVTVWCAVSNKFIIGSYFYEEQGNTVTVNSICYMNMLNNFLKPELRKIKQNKSIRWMFGFNKMKHFIALVPP